MRNIGLIRLVAAAALVAALIACGTETVQPSAATRPIRGPIEWAAEFGGAPAGYAEILAMTDCSTSWKLRSHTRQ